MLQAIRELAPARDEDARIELLFDNGNTRARTLYAVKGDEIVPLEHATMNEQTAFYRYLSFNVLATSVATILVISIRRSHAWPVNGSP